MHDPLFFTAEPLVGRILLTGGDSRHLLMVRRARPGDRVRVSDGAGTVVEGTIVAIGSAGVEVEPAAEERVPRPWPAVRVFQGLAKGAKVDLVVQKVVELGADEVVVFAAGRSVPRWDQGKRRLMAARWALIAREAAKQSRRAWLPAVTGPLSLAEAASMLTGGLALLADETSSSPLREVLPGPGPDRLDVLVGPEGGLTSAERDAFVAAGAVPFSLGPQILRTETAAVAAAALVLHRCGRLG